MHSSWASPLNKSFAALAVLISMAAPASAMSLRPGIEVGASYLTFVRGSDAGPYASDWSWHPSIGFVLESELPRRVRIASGVHWARGGARTHASDSYFDDSNEARESWLTGDLSIQPIHTVHGELQAIHRSLSKLSQPNFRRYLVDLL